MTQIAIEISDGDLKLFETALHRHGYKVGDSIGLLALLLREQIEASVKLVGSSKSALEVIKREHPELNVKRYWEA